MRSEKRGRECGKGGVSDMDGGFEELGNGFEETGKGKRRWRERYVVEGIRGPGEGDSSARERRGEMILRRVGDGVEDKDRMLTEMEWRSR
jgi:hypothetical protein